MTVRRARLARILSLALAVSGTLPVSALAQTVDVEAVAPDEGKERYVVHTGYGNVFKSDVSGGGRVSNHNFLAGIGGRFDLSDSVSLSPRFIYSLDAYDITNGAAPLGWQNINQYTFLAIADWQINEKWNLLGGPILRFSGEGSAAFDDGTTGGALLGFNYKVNPDFSVGLALGLISQIEDDPGLIPIPMIRWHFAEDWTAKMGISQLGGRSGVGPELTWAFAKEWDVGVGFQFQRKRYRLNDHGGNAGHIGEDSSLPVFLRLGFHPMKELTVQVFGGIVAAGELKTQDVGGDRTFDRGYDTTPTLGIQANYRF